MRLTLTKKLSEISLI